MTSSARLRVALALAVVCATPAQAASQLSAPCRIACAAALGVTGFVVGTGTSAAAGRIVGGFSTMGEGARYWGAGFGVAVGAGLLLSADGARQERAVYASTVGSVAGALVGLGFATLSREGDAPARWASTLIGAAAGALVGGAYGALSHTRSGSAGPAAALVPRASLGVALSVR